MINLKKMNKKFEEIMEKETFSGKNQTAPCNIDDIIVPKGTLCDVCGSNDIIEAPKTSVKPSSLQEMIERNEAKIQADKLKK